MPARESVAPRTRPAHDVFGCGPLPKGEVHLVALLADAVELARVVDHVGKVASGQDAVAVVIVVLLHVEIDAAVALIGVAVGEDLLHQLLLLDDVSRGVGLDGGRQAAKLSHRVVIAVGVILCYLHRLQLLQPCLFLNLVVALVGVMLQVSHIGDVAHIAHLVADVLQVAEEHVEGDGGARVAQMRVAIDGGSADIHAHVGGVDRLEPLLLAVQRIVDDQILHCLSVFIIQVQRYGFSP